MWLVFALVAGGAEKELLELAVCCRRRAHHRFMAGFPALYHQSIPTRRPRAEKTKKARIIIVACAMELSDGTTSASGARENQPRAHVHPKTSESSVSVSAPAATLPGDAENACRRSSGGPLIRGSTVLAIARMHVSGAPASV